ncbi:hypothetical protein L3Q82_003663 [Scortum barcoo]|uniref:Uncharacterized protein n=1 Tax=Scortum barcoo TaxID=214431 RepID=A0ACB8VND4_9TELE|nr:hypothetical protein L3Q82_003663 [Scortum barcoo]
MFDHSSPAREASRALLGLRQRNRRVVDYAIEFRTLVVDSGWNSPAIKDAFVKERQVINTPNDPPKDFEDLVDLAVCIDILLQERESERRRTGRRSSEPPGAPGGFREFCRSFNALNPAEDRAPPSSREELMLGCTKLVPKERQRSLKEGTCFYCGLTGHCVGTCSSKDKAHQE